ncbi:hypothetical protein SPPR111872_06300 [Sphingobacterium prati]
MEFLKLNQMSGRLTKSLCFFELKGYRIILQKYIMVKFIHLNTASGRKVVFNVDNIFYLIELKDSKYGSKTQVS